MLIWPPAVLHGRSLSLWPRLREVFHQIIWREYESYKEGGVQNVKLIFENGPFGKIPPTQHVEEASRFLDSRLTR
jgi:hypothetical protein